MCDKLHGHPFSSGWDIWWTDRTIPAFVMLQAMSKNSTA